MKPPVYDPQWSEEVKVVYQHDVEEIWNPRIAPHVWNQYHNLLDIYLGMIDDEPRQVLDIGCAQATLALRLAEKGHRVTAVDIRQGFLDYAQSRHTHGDITFICGNALELNFEPVFDVVFANQILEHLVYPERFVSKLKEWIRPNGRLIMTTPNGHYLKNSLPSFKALSDPSRWEHLANSADGEGHFFAYRVEELDEILGSAGFHTREISWFETPWISGHMKVRHIHSLLPWKLLRKFDRLLRGAPGLGRRFSHQLLVVAVRDR